MGGVGEAKLRVARPTDDLAPLIRFYRDGLGLEVLTSFSGHNGFDGVMLGAPHAPWHLEFTVAHGHPAPRAPSPDNLLVFYLPDRGGWEQAVGRMRAAGHAPVSSFNPFWDDCGLTFEDPDGWRVVLQNAAWQR